MPTQAAKLRHRRRSTPKVKTGCVTCKFRRVKCDESKPNCEKCRKSGFHCDGYPTEIQNTTETTPARLAPKKSPNFAPIFWGPSVALFKNSRDYRYFQSFCEKTSLRLDGFVPTDLWSRLMLQACERSEYIRHGLVAIAALDLISDISHSRLHALRNSDLDTKTHHEFALHQYGCALRHMKKAVTQPDQDLATLLLSCLVIICFETFHGNTNSAISQIGIGMKMIERAAKADVNDIRHKELSSIEEEVIRAFIRLDMQSLYNEGTNSTAFRERFVLVDLTSMPSRFRSLKQAGYYRDLVMTQWMHFMDTMLQGHTDEGREMPTLSSCESFAEQAAYYLGISQRWQTAFQPLFIRSRCNPGGSDFLAAELLALHSLSVRFLYQSIPVNGRPPKMHDSMPLFTEMIALSRVIIGNPADRKNQGRFTFVPQVIIPLYLVGFTCPHWPTRREAVDLLLSTRWREGLWDATMVGQIVHWVMSIEAEYLEHEYLREDMRMMKLKIAPDLMARTVRCQGMMPIEGGTEFRSVKAVLKW